MEKVTDIEIYLNDIAEKLYNGHASLMVGAGFSMNAQCDGISSKKFPSWSDLGDCFYKKVHGSAPSEDKKCYLDVLKLAEEVEVTVGRAALNKLLQDEIPDLEYQPSELHRMLLQLPWTDVFTTNYDTLLERTAEKILEQRYETVINKEDLVWSTKPRIIKLHGSFPSDRPFIITEEDYRKYPRDFAPFVNTVQQSLLENTLCLIGFSGNDPNFQKWIGWIRDNLGKDNSPKIYLIGVLSLSEGERKLLECRNVIPVDLTRYSTMHSDALRLFIEKLKAKGAKTDNNFNYPKNENRISLTNKEDLPNQFKKIINIWKQTREEYPNWLILPKESRDKLYELTRIYYINKINNLEPELALTFLYEFNWRIEKCLFPILNEWIQYYETAVSKYNPFPNIFQIENANTPQENDGINWESIKSYWIELQLSMLRYYREENINDKWNELAAKIDSIKKKLSAELLARYCYERCLYFMFVLDISSVRKELNNWPTNTALPYWEAKRAGLMAELGNTKEAEKILETSLNEVRNRLTLKPINNDYLLISQESYILQLLQYVKRALYLFHNSEKLEETKEYSKRWNTLAQYKCDPWGELKTFEYLLNTNSENKNEYDTKYNFEIGSKSRTFYLNNSPTYTMDAYSFLRYIEETGIPLKMPNITFGDKSAKRAIICISDYSPNWAFISFIRSGNKETIKDIWNRRSLAFYSQKRCDELVHFYLKALRETEMERQKGDIYYRENFAILLSTVFPEALSRLCVKCSFEVRKELLLFIRELYVSYSTSKSTYTGINKLVQKITTSFSTEEQYNLIPDLLEFPIILEPDETDSFIDPLRLLNIDKISQNNNKNIDVNKRIEKLLSYLTNNATTKEIAITSLDVLRRLNLLTNAQEQEFGTALWSSVGNDGFPINTNFDKFHFLKLPHPQHINPQELLRNYIEISELPIQANDKTYEISDTGGSRLPLFQDIIGTTYKKTEYIWQAEDINNLAKKIIDWWNADKEYLKDTRDRFMGSYSEKFKARFKNMINVFSQLFVKHTSLINPLNKKAIQTLLDELSEYNMEDLEAKSSFIRIFPESKRSLYKEINKKLYSKNEDEIFDALNAVLVLVEQRYEDTSILINSIIENIKNRKEPGLDKYIETLNELLSTNKSLFTEEVLSELQIGFEYLYDEISIQKGDSEEDVHLKLLKKSRASRFLVTLKKYYIEELEIELPTYISQWEELCLNVDEFCEIRNIWLNGNAN
ncbi:SIR2 family protein [Bacteroides graminisolvens]|uniref:SIR2 family protein n=1 Tax=Bacteroides graminisolvens TaxID=477666 RepID=UPI0029C8F548|nr:SIR2 family protein [Bacteroides graminisolvens]